MRSPTAASASATRQRGRAKKRHRLSKNEVALLEETHRAHKRESWRAQTELYNAAARQRGWLDAVTVETYTRRCRFLDMEAQFKTKGAAGDGVPACRPWESFEVEALESWSWSGRFKHRYTEFIKHMREEVDPNYFRSMTSIASRLPILSKRRAGASAAAPPIQVKGEPMEETELMEDTTAVQDGAKQAAVYDGSAEQAAVHDGSVRSTAAFNEDRKETKPKRHVLTKEEVALVEETYRELKHKKWRTQVAAYNKSAKQRGWYANVSVEVYSRRCRRLDRERPFKEEGGGGAKRRAGRKLWAPFEDEALENWNWSGRFKHRYPAFIEHMREEVDPNYFRSMASIASRFPILAKRRTIKPIARDDQIKTEPTDTSRYKQLETCDLDAVETIVPTSYDHSFDRQNESVLQSPSTGDTGNPRTSMENDEGSLPQASVCPPEQPKKRATLPAASHQTAVADTTSADPTDTTRSEEPEVASVDSDQVMDSASSFTFDRASESASWSSPTRSAMSPHYSLGGDVGPSSQSTRYAPDQTQNYAGQSKYTANRCR